MDTYDAKISQVIFHKPSKFSPSGTPYLIAKTDDGRVVKGEHRKPEIGVTYRFWGSWKNDPRNGKSFDFSAYDEVVSKNPRSIALYLSKNVDGLGIKRADAIVAHFADETLDILRKTPERISEVSSISKTTADKVVGWFRENANDPAAYAELLAIFDGFRVPKKLIENLVKDHRSGAPTFVRENPYRLLEYPRAGWDTVDKIARERLAIAIDSPDRIAAAIEESLARISLNGHTVASEGTLLTQAVSLLGIAIPKDEWQKFHASCVCEGYSATGNWYASRRLFNAEQSIANSIQILANAIVPSLEIPETALAGLNAKQATALRMIAENPVSILVGGPGTGKTFTITRLLSCLDRESWHRIRFCAPTGKAAKRGEELLCTTLGEDAFMIACATIHKALEPQPSTESEGVPSDSAKQGRGRDEFTFGKSEDLPIDADLIVVDETSMLDSRIAASLLRAISPGTRIVFVGDPNQLPSVGPGSVLRDLLGSKSIPTVELDEPRRNSGRIVQACHAIKRGEIPRPSTKIDFERGENWLHLECDEHEIPEFISEFYGNVKKYDKVWDLQVICASRDKLPYGCAAMNALLSPLLNPLRDPSEQSEELQRRGYVIGDKVVRTSNGKCNRLIPRNATSDFDWSTGKFEYENHEHFGKWRGMDLAAAKDVVVNGDMGTVLDILDPVGKRPAQVIVKLRWPDRLVAFDLGEADLMQAYAMTVHKCQGSGFPIAIVPVSSRYYWDFKTQTGLASKELFYTAASRAEQLLVTVGPESVISDYVKRATIGTRQTLLPSFLNQMTRRKVLSVA